MQTESSSADASKAVVSTRTMEIAVSIGFFLIGALVMWDSIRLGHRWGDSGPQSGYFPFYIALFLLLASGANALAMIFGASAREKGTKPFVTWGQFKPVLAVFFPLALYILGMQYIGFYAAVMLFIALFMRVNGKYGLGKILPVAIGVPVVVYVMFEIWFLVPLPKGPLADLVGL